MFPADAFLAGLRVKSRGVNIKEAIMVQMDVFCRPAAAANPAPMA